MLSLSPWHQQAAVLVVFLLFVWVLVRARRRYKARKPTTQYRTANGTVIDKQTRHIQSQPMATRRLRAGNIIPLARPTPLHAVPSRDQQLAEIKKRGQLAALHDKAIGRTDKRSVSPYTLGSTEHSYWLSGYLNVSQATVQTTAHQASNDAAAA